MTDWADTWHPVTYGWWLVIVPPRWAEDQTSYMFDMREAWHG